MQDRHKRRRERDEIRRTPCERKTRVNLQHRAFMVAAAATVMPACLFPSLASLVGQDANDGSSEAMADARADDASHEAMTDVAADEDTSARDASEDAGDATPDAGDASTDAGDASPTSVTLVGTTTASGNFGAAVLIVAPTVQAGDLLIAAAGTNGTPASWNTPTGWTAGANGGQVDGQGLNWWWKIATNADSGATITLLSSAYADGGGIVLALRGVSSSPIRGVSTLANNDNFGNGNVTAPQFNSVSWTGSAKIVSVVLMSWQPTSTNITWPTGYATQVTADDGFSYVAAGANLTTQTASSLGTQMATLSAAQAVVPTLQLAIWVQ